MSEPHYFEPTWLSPPGNTIADLIQLKGVDQSDLADLAGERVEVIEDLLVGRGRLTKSIAIALAELLGGSERFWLNRDRQYQEDITRHRLLVDEEPSQWLAEIPVTELMNLGWIPKVDVKRRLQVALDYFGASDLSAWRKSYSGLVSAVSFRTSPTFSSHLGSVLAWLRMGQLGARDQADNRFDPTRLAELVGEMRSLTRLKRPADFIPRLTALCNSAGVALVVAEAPKGCKASGGTWVTDDGVAICLLSRRYRTDDQFWFTFFHEIGHLCLHSDRSIFLENGDGGQNDEEIEANQFSQDVLIPHAERVELMNLTKSRKAVIRFALHSGTSAGIVTGQMQHLGIIPPTWLNDLKRRLEWDATP